MDFKTPEILWSVDVYGKTAKQAMTEFCGTFWPDGPRKLSQPKPCGRGGSIFTTRGGVRWYWCRILDNAKPDTWGISVYEPRAAIDKAKAGE